MPAFVLDIRSDVPPRIAALPFPTTLKSFFDRDIRMNTILHLGAERGHADVVAVGLKHRLDVNGANIMGDTPLIAACKRGHDAVIDVLLGAPDINLVLPNHAGNTPLHYLAFGRRAALAKKLLDHQLEHDPHALSIASVTNRQGKKPSELSSGACRDVLVAAEEGATTASVTEVAHLPADALQRPEALQDEAKRQFLAAQRRVGWEIQPTSIKNQSLLLDSKFKFVRSGNWNAYRVAWKAAKEEPSAALLALARQEAEALVALYHPNLHPLLGVCLKWPDVGVLTELAPRGNLGHILYDGNIDIDPAQALKIASDIARAMAYLHSLPEPIYHWNLSLSNVLVMDDDSVRVADYGFAQAPLTTRNVSGGLLYNAQWLAPEVLRGDPKAQQRQDAVDMYAFGIMLTEIMLRQPAFGENMNSMAIGILVVIQKLRPILPDFLPDPLTDLIRRCWHEVPAQRPSFQQAVIELAGIL